MKYNFVFMDRSGKRCIMLLTSLGKDGKVTVEVAKTFEVHSLFHGPASFPQIATDLGMEIIISIWETKFFYILFDITQ